MAGQTIVIHRGQQAIHTTAELCGIAGDEAPLTDADKALVVERAVDSDPDARTPGRGTSGHAGGLFVLTLTDQRGIWARVVDYRDGRQARAGLLLWHDAEALLRARETGRQLSLFEGM